MENCAHRESGRLCPISKTPCLGECIYANILDDISLGIIGLDTRKREVFFQNKSACNMFKSTISPKDYNALVSLLLPEAGEFLAADKPNVSKTVRYGNKFIGCNIFRISDIYIWMYVSDITEKIRLNTIAESVNTMNNLGFIFSGIRHELGNPINSIKTTVTVLMDNINTYSREMVTEFLYRTRSDINRVEYLLKELKSFSMYENPELQNVNISLFMNNLLSIVERDLAKNNIEVKAVVRPEAAWGRCDSRALQQVMLNLLSNASDALQGRKNPEIIISIFKSSGRIIIKVKDNGCGIPDEHKKHLFKPFSTTKKSGTGLGLVIVKNMLSKMDGTIDIESHENAGTVATLNLPEGHNGGFVG